MFSVSTHVLDTGTGQPASGIEVTLSHESNSGWVGVGSGVTDGDGRIGELGNDLEPGSYRLVFDTSGQSHPFYPEIAVTVLLDGGKPHYHLPLLLNAYGYTTYRGS